MKAKLKNAPYLLFLLVIPVLGLIYQVLNTHPGNAVILSTEIDSAIPFMPIFIVPYILWYGFIFGYLVYYCFKDKQVYLQTLTIIVVGELICFFIYFFFQTTVPRPDITGDGLLFDLVKLIYTNDEPFNCFPSIHVLTTFAIMLGSMHINNKHLFRTIFIPLLGTLIIISTLFVKQHVIFDMIGSMFLVSFIYGIVFELYQFQWREKSDTVYVKNK
jgi:membrane-associated phospholipid phosphatase